MNKKVKFAVFASGNGSNFQAIVDAVKNEELSAELVLLVTDKPGCYSVTRAQNAGVETLEVSPKDFATKEAYETAILEKLQALQVEWIILAGYMRLIGDTLLEAYGGKMVNIHPSLLPAFPGKDAIGQAIRANVAETGVTVHYVDAGMDTGPIISQQALQIVGLDQAEVENHIHAIEHELYKRTLQHLWGGNTTDETRIN